MSKSMPKTNRGKTEMKTKPSLNYNQVDWDGFESIPEESTFNEWASERMRKHRAGVTQSAIKLIKPHINQLYKIGVEADQAFTIAASKAWQGIRYAWIVKYLQEDMDDFTDHKSTRDMTLEHEMDRGWGKSNIELVSYSDKS